MLSTIATAAWSSPTIDYHALAPEMILGAGIVLLLLLDLFLSDTKLPAELFELGLVRLDYSLQLSAMHLGRYH